ncbi:MAG: DSD1 family PLP-dependent enzyme [Planctomycetes bacterium]|nr:DSD1 family PLP-dependent enzyme [Planctomycetota bacterium]
MDNSMIGSSVLDIDTPALLIDLEKLEYNLKKMADFFKEKDSDLRPHIKTHKTPVLAHKQIKAGAIGIACQKLAEAETMAKAGLDDILITNEVVGDQKIRRLVNLAKTTDVKTVVDNKENVISISAAAQERGVEVGILVEVNTGMNRCGVLPGTPVLELAQEIDKQKGTKFLGLMGYEGHTVFIETYERRKREAQKALKLLIDTKELLERNGYECKIVNAGGTGTYDISGTYPGVTEVTAGSYLTMDVKYSGIEGVEFEQALSLLTTVISRPTHDRAILDAGMKAITIEFGMPLIKSAKGGAKLYKLAEEHGYVELEAPDTKLDVGEKIELVPSHGCTTINLHDRFYAIRDNQVESVWPIEARGKQRSIRDDNRPTPE